VMLNDDKIRRIPTDFVCDLTTSYCWQHHIWSTSLFCFYFLYFIKFMVVIDYEHEFVENCLF